MRSTLAPFISHTKIRKKNTLDLKMFNFPFLISVVFSGTQQKIIELLLTTVPNEEELDEVIVIGPSPRWRRH